jgi:hypothetical protein
MCALTGASRTCAIVQAAPFLLPIEAQAMTILLPNAALQNGLTSSTIPIMEFHTQGNPLYRLYYVAPYYHNMSFRN